MRLDPISKFFGAGPSHTQVAHGMDNTKATGRHFGAALCRHFGLPSDQVSTDIDVLTGVDDVFGVTLYIYLTADDLAGIAQELKNGPPSIPEPSHIR